ncbi:hypothetical protein EPUS_06955 [Endocarpon pusillum Z07020]|uniref:Conserved oligomeric Golgi complex subunit 8 n=1 Tax=Endocarpon pusillum (strain Z07020 / HMAS-L-300199) TaxID=1263415 RepID=U1GFH3_ENDPU|nr:uncharacterized protein EPUS_06955 [Endocarpon pusillum Z07020]ERF76397.1 hypothetical protein EPUS_06955 [Endocarpon pusillum Z07020]
MAADPLYELLASHLNPNVSTSSQVAPSSSVHFNATSYLSHLTSLSLSALSTTETQSLAQALNTNLLSLQALSSRSHRSVITTSNALSTLGEYLPALTSSAFNLRKGVPDLDEKAVAFLQRYSKSNTDNAVLDRRKRAMLLSRNVDRISDILELPTLLATAIASSSTPSASSGSAASSVNYSQALDLFAHIKRLQMIHPDSALVQSILEEAEGVMKDMTSNLISSLRGQNIRLAAAIRTIGWLRRVAPELATQGVRLSSAKCAQSSPYSTSRSFTHTSSEGSFGYLFLVCRLYNLLNMLEALAPLRDLADQETQQRLQRQTRSTITSPSHEQPSSQRKLFMYCHSAFTGQQTERYLKRYIEIFREQSFATVSMYKNIFPPASDDPNTITNSTSSSPAPATSPSTPSPPFLTLPQTLQTFPIHLISHLTSTLQQYLPNLTDPSARDSLLMQVLYAAGSLGRLGADFSMVIESLLDDDDDNDDKDKGEEEGEIGEKEIAQLKGEPARGLEAAEAAAAAVKDYDDAASLPLAQQTTSRERTTDQKPKDGGSDGDGGGDMPIPEWIRILQKHRLQSSRLEALSSSAPPSAPSSAGQDKQRLNTTTSSGLLPRKGSASQEAVVK